MKLYEMLSIVPGNAEVQVENKYRGVTQVVKGDALQVLDALGRDRVTEFTVDRVSACGDCLVVETKNNLFREGGAK